MSNPFDIDLGRLRIGPSELTPAQQRILDDMRAGIGVVYRDRRTGAIVGVSGVQMPAPETPYQGPDISDENIA